MVPFLLALTNQECDSSYVWIDGPQLPIWNYDSNCFYQADLEVLQTFINLNENLNGLVHLEIGLQNWELGRLLHLSLQSNDLSLIPENIDELT